MTDLVELLKKAEGADRGLDLELAAVLLNAEADPNYWAWQSSRPKGTPERPKADFWKTKDRCPPLTGSLDAAIALIPEGHGWRVEWKSRVTGKAWATSGPEGAQEGAHGNTPVLALLITILWARGIGEPE